MSPKPDWGEQGNAATNGAIATFMKGLAKELGARGIRVNAIAPGPVWTRLRRGELRHGGGARRHRRQPLA
jgi:NAD(P)-dependent dehydrogenase (short-subunit alcohol dehydrogenase family)